MRASNCMRIRRAPSRRCHRPDQAALRIVDSVGGHERRGRRRVRDDRIDVLIDASGHTIYNRLPLFAWKPAPLQVSWPGYFASTGMRAIDYVLGDRYVMPSGEAAHFVERAWHLPDSYLCFTPPDVELEVGVPPMLANGYPTFGYFGKLAKITDRVVAVWPRAARHAASEAVREAPHLDDAREQDTLATRFAAHGIAAARLLFEGRSPRAEYLAAYRRVDLMLARSRTRAARRRPKRCGWACRCLPPRRAISVAYLREPAARGALTGMDRGRRRRVCREGRRSGQRCGRAGRAEGEPVRRSSPRRCAMRPFCTPFRGCAARDVGRPRRGRVGRVVVVIDRSVL